MLSVSDLLIKAGIPDISLSEDGYPDAGQIVRFYRKKVGYLDSTGKFRSWTQSDLARTLNVSEVTIRLMEKKGKGLDSIERRRFLAGVLNIPPVLLGLGSLGDLEKFLDGYNVKMPSNDRKASTISKDSINLYNDVLNTYWNMYYSSIDNDSMRNLNNWVDRIKSEFVANPNELRALLCGFYRLTGNILRDQTQYSKATRLLEEALEVAGSDKDQTAAILYYLGKTRLDEGKPSVAKTYLAQAVSLAPSNAPLRGAVYQLAGLATAAVSEGSTKQALTLLDKAEQSIGSNEEDLYSMKFGQGRYLLERADALLELNKPKSALSLLDDAEEDIPAIQQKRRGYLNILRADAYLSLKNPDPGYATRYLTDAFFLSSQAESHYNIDYISRLYYKIRNGPTGNSGDIAELGANLSRWKKAH